MKIKILLILIMLVFPLSLLYGITIPANNINYVALAFDPKPGLNKKYIERIEDIDFNNPVDFMVCDNDSIFYLEFTNRACRQDNRYWVRQKRYFNNEFSAYDHISEYSAYYKELIEFYIFESGCMLGLGDCFITSWVVVDPYHPDSLKLLGVQPLPARTGIETIGIIRSARFPDGSILLALSNLGQDRVCFLRGVSLIDFKVLYSHDWDKLGCGKIDLVGRHDDKETTYVCNFNYLYTPVYQIYEIIRYDRAHPRGSTAYITLDKVETRIIDLWDLARKRFHIKGKFDRYK